MNKPEPPECSKKTVTTNIHEPTASACERLNIFDQYDVKHEIELPGTADGFRTNLINTLYKNNKPEHFRHVLIAFWLAPHERVDDPEKVPFSETKYTLKDGTTLIFDKVYKALDPKTGCSASISFIGIHTISDPSRRFGSRLVQIRSHQPISHTTTSEIPSTRASSLPVDHLRYCLVTQRSDGQYFLLT